MSEVNKCEAMVRELCTRLSSERRSSHVRYDEFSAEFSRAECSIVASVLAALFPRAGLIRLPATLCQSGRDGCSPRQQPLGGERSRVHFAGTVPGR